MATKPYDADSFNFLKVMVEYMRTPGSQKIIPYHKMGEIFGLDQNTCQRNVAILRGRHENMHPYVKVEPGPDHQPIVVVKLDGYQYVDSALGNLCKSGSTFDGCTFINSPVAGNDNNGVQNVSVMNYIDLKKVLADVEKALPGAGLSVDNEGMVREEIASINEDMDSNRPNEGHIKRGVKRILSILQTSANITTVSPFIASLGAFLNSLELG